MAKVACAIALVSGAVPLSGCSQIPVANTYPAEYQPRMQSVAHWRALAVELVGAIEQQRRVDPPSPPSPFTSSRSRPGPRSATASTPC